jgi:hypothetical protein
MPSRPLPLLCVLALLSGVARAAEPICSAAGVWSEGPLEALERGAPPHVRLARAPPRRLAPPRAAAHRCFHPHCWRRDVAARLGSGPPDAARSPPAGPVLAQTALRALVVCHAGALRANAAGRKLAERPAHRALAGRGATAARHTCSASSCADAASAALRRADAVPGAADAAEQQVGDICGRLDQQPDLSGGAVRSGQGSGRRRPQVVSRRGGPGRASGDGVQVRATAACGADTRRLVRGALQALRGERCPG